MKYAKPPLTFEQQADLLLKRGMAGDRTEIVSRLRAVGYYRLSGYWYPFRQVDATDPQRRLDTFVPATTIQEVWNRYAFDRQLRLLLLDAIERIEIAVRSHLAHGHAQRHGIFAYAINPASLPECQPDRLANFLDAVRVESDRSRDAFVQHFKAKYSDTHRCLPVWMAVEIMAFGSVLTFYRGCEKDLRREIARPFDVQETVFDSWLLALNTVRNICAHHGRLWNRELGTKPKIPSKNSAWNIPVKIRGDRIFGILTLCKWCLNRIAPQSRWAHRLRALLDEYPAIPRMSMGFPNSWEESPIWMPDTVAFQLTKRQDSQSL